SVEALLEGCTHGPDPIVHEHDADEALRSGERPLPTTYPCTPDDNGPMMRVFYAYTDVNRLDQGNPSPRAVIMQAVANSDDMVASAAKKQGGNRHIRF